MVTRKGRIRGKSPWMAPGRVGNGGYRRDPAILSRYNLPCRCHFVKNSMQEAEFERIAAMYHPLSARMWSTGRENSGGSRLVREHQVEEDVRV